MRSVTIARLSCLVGAAVCFVGLAIATMSAVPFASDATYFWIGIVVTVLGVVMAPIAFAYPARSPLRLARIVVGLGLLACVGLVLSGAPLVAGSFGLLGAKAPGWIPNASAFALTGLFVWVLLASYSTRRSPTLGRGTFWFGMLAGTSCLLAGLDSVLLSVLTNPTTPLDLTSPLLP